MWSNWRSSKSVTLGDTWAMFLHVNWKPFAARFSVKDENFDCGVDGELSTNTRSPVAEATGEDAAAHAIGSASAMTAKSVTRNVRNSDGDVVADVCALCRAMLALYGFVGVDCRSRSSDSGRFRCCEGSKQDRARGVHVVAAGRAWCAVRIRSQVELRSIQSV